MTADPPGSLFDAYLIVDWSAAALPRRGRDSIWYALVLRGPHGVRRAALANPATRAAATDELGRRLARLAGDGRRVLVGFDFPFGYPAGTGARLDLKTPYWRHMWQLLSDRVEDGPDNANNRFRVAAALNRAISGAAFPFWGHPHQHRYDGLSPTKPPGYGGAGLPERRLIERRVPTAKPVWQLAGNGSVGGQVLTGLPRLLALRSDPRIAMLSAVWPMETGLRHDASAQILFAEVYPSILPSARLPGYPKDAGQVLGAARYLARLDGCGGLGAWFAGDPALSADARVLVEQEEAWILGVTDAAPEINPRLRV